MFSCLNALFPVATKKHPACEDNSQRRRLQTAYCSFSPNNIRNAPQSLSLFTRWFLVFFSGVSASFVLKLFFHQTRIFPHGAVKTKVDFNPVGVVGMAAAPSLSSVWPLIRRGYITPTRSGARSRNTCAVQVTSSSSSSINRLPSLPLPLQWLIEIFHLSFQVIPE